MTNTGRYRREGEPTNAKCDGCGKDIWMRVAIGHTISHGHKYWPNDLSTKTPESVVTLNGNRIGLVCPECWEKMNE